MKWMGKKLSKLNVHIAKQNKTNTKTRRKEWGEKCQTNYGGREGLTQMWKTVSKSKTEVERSVMRYRKRSKGHSVRGAHIWKLPKLSPSDKPKDDNSSIVIKSSSNLKKKKDGETRIAEQEAENNIFSKSRWICSSMNLGMWVYWGKAAAAMCRD